MYSQDEGVAWPSYVDFLSCFIFILIIFLGSLLYLMTGDIRQRLTQNEFRRTQGELQGLGISDARADGLRLVVPLRGIVNFAIGCPTPQGECAALSEASQTKLKSVATALSRYNRCGAIVLRGQTDAQQYQDPFGNWELSNRRALTVFKFFATCQDCDEHFLEIQNKMSLAGIGDREAKTDIKTLDNPLYRTVDVIVDCSRQ